MPQHMRRVPSQDHVCIEETVSHFWCRFSLITYFSPSSTSCAIGYVSGVIVFFILSQSIQNKSEEYFKKKSRYVYVWNLGCIVVSTLTLQDSGPGSESLETRLSLICQYDFGVGSSSSKMCTRQFLELSGKERQ